MIILSLSLTVARIQAVAIKEFNIEMTEIRDQWDSLKKEFAIMTCARLIVLCFTSQRGRR